MQLDRHNLGLAVRVAVYQKYGTAAAAAKAIGMDPQYLRRAWGTGSNPCRYLSMTSMLIVLDKLGYEIYFNVEIKDGTDMRSMPKVLPSREERVLVDRRNANSAQRQHPR